MAWVTPPKPDGPLAHFQAPIFPSGRRGNPGVGSHDDGNMQQAPGGTPGRGAVGENPRLGLFAQQTSAHPLYQGKHANRHPAAAVHSVGRDPGEADLQILGSHQNPWGKATRDVLNVHGLC
jgi:hypothetical protein